MMMLLDDDDVLLRLEKRRQRQKPRVQPNSSFPRIHIARGRFRIFVSTRNRGCEKRVSFTNF